MLVGSVSLRDLENRDFVWIINYDYRQSPVRVMAFRITNMNHDTS